MTPTRASGAPARGRKFGGIGRKKMTPVVGRRLAPAGCHGFAVSLGEVCPVWPGQSLTAHWGVPDPAAVTGTDVEISLAFAETYRILHNRLDIFVNLPFSALDKLALQRHLEEIGSIEPSDAATTT